MNEKTENRATMALLGIGLLVITTAMAVVACTPKVTPQPGYGQGYSDGACMALTGSPACDYELMIACQDPRGIDATNAFPCAWIPARDNTAKIRSTDGTILVIVDHSCPDMVWPRGARCVEVTPMDHRGTQ